jgi:hypothetical protein
MHVSTLNQLRNISLDRSAGRVSAVETTPFVNRGSVAENTTGLLEPLPRKVKRESENAHD